MPRMHLYLPLELYEEVKARKLPASELLQEAIRAEVHRQELLEETDRYLEELIAEVGAPTEEEMAEAVALADRIRRECQISPTTSRPRDAPAHS